ncbi:MAG: HEAT repeat domain-containing protein, partial [Planctomycetes bacterium]|nr:HEAT repeat domain-containing protein [Planctomycetota bacterium]
SVRQALLWVLGRSGRKDAAALLIEQLGDKAVRCAAADALTDLTGMGFGTDCERWRSWWAQHKDVDGERWLEQRLAYQGSRARRLEGELERTRAQLVRLHQQLYSRLPVADRLGHVQAAAEQEDVVIRQLAVQWSAELLASPVGRDDPLARVPRTQQALAELLMRLSHDGSADVQRMAILALGRVPGEATFERLRSLVQQGRAPARAAAVRALAQQARAEKTARQKEVVAVLQKALDDPALEVVVEAAEDLGALGVPEAGPVLVCLLRHSSDHVRQAAVHALERVADASVLDELLAALDDPVVAVRFGLVGAVSRSATGGAPLEDKQQERLLARLQTILQKDADPGVRSRAATVLGECGDPSVLPSLWERVVAVEDSRVQEKAWAAFVEVHVRAENLDLLKEWNGTLARANQRQRRVLLLNAAYQRWQQHPGSESLVAPAAELLAGTQLELGNWSAAVPLLRVLLARAGTTLARERVLQSLLVAAEQALREGNRVAARATVAEARLYLPRDSKLAAEFDNVEKRSQQGNPKSEIGAPARAGHPK